MTESKEAMILMVEDSENDAELIMLALKTNKIANEIFWVKDGEEALEFMGGSGKYANRDVNKLPIVILLDLKLPKVDGLTVLKQLKTDERTMKIPVVIVTASQEKKDMEEAYRLGANSFIIKPIEINQFIAAISEIGLYWMVINKTS